MKKNKKILVILHENYFPPHKGYRKIAIDRLNILSNFFNIDIIMPTYSDSDLTHFNKKKLNIIKFKNKKKYFELIISLLKIFPGQVSIYTNREYKNFIKSKSINKFYDFIYTFTLRSMINIPLDSINYGKFILDLIDPPSQTFLNRAKKNFILSPVYFIEYLLLKKYEKKVSKIADKTLIVSERDKFFLKNTFKNIFSLPHCIEHNVFKERSLENRFANTFCFTGNLNYIENIKSIDFIVKDILPKLYLKNKKICFHIIGSNADAMKKKYLDIPNIEIISNPENMLEILSCYRACVVPQTIEFGCISKIPECISVNTPIITSKVNFEGAEAEEYFKYLIADTAVEFIDKINDLLHKKEYFYNFKNDAENYRINNSKSFLEQKLLNIFS